MRRKIALLASAMFLTLFVIEVAYADSMRCGRHLIRDGGWRGPSMYEVLKKCGEPTYRNGNSWVYEETRSRYRKVLRFNHDGLLVSIVEK
jgi:hypothetical protein